MRDLIPVEVLSSIRDRYLAGVADAEASYSLNAADEDALTGALGQAISTPYRINHRVGEDVYQWRVYSAKIRGRGAGAPEKSQGADGIFQIEISDGTGKLLRQKGLPFQSKKVWSHSDKKLVEQAKLMIETAGCGIVVDYTKNGYTACDAKAVIDAKGSIVQARKTDSLNNLGQLLANEFLNCDIGRKDLFYSEMDEKFKFQSLLGSNDTTIITTDIIKFRP